MAASATRKKDITIHGAGGARVETGVIVFDNDATVEVPTKLGVIYSASFTKVGDAGDANALSIDETAGGDGVPVSGGFVTVDATANNSLTYLYRFEGR
jgi:hypothetical protein